MAGWLHSPCPQPPRPPPEAACTTDPQRRYEVQAQLCGGVMYENRFRGGVAGVVDNAANLVIIIGSFSYKESALMKAIDDALATVR